MLSNMHKNSKNEPKTRKTARGTSMEAWRTKMEVLKRDWRWRSGWCLHADLKLVVTSPYPSLFTKLPLWEVELQKCHSGRQMLAHSLCWRGNDMKMMWKWCGNSLQLNIDVQAPKLLHPKCLKIIKNKN